MTLGMPAAPTVMSSLLLNEPPLPVVDRRRATDYGAPRRRAGRRQDAEECVGDVLCLAWRRGRS